MNSYSIIRTSFKQIESSLENRRNKVCTFFRITLLKSLTFSLRDINTEDSKYYMEKQRHLEAKIKEQEYTINKLQVELMSDSPVCIIIIVTTI
jgi:hypothetical protein